MTEPIRLYRYALSGHAHRVQLMLSLLQLPCELIDVDLPAGAHKTPAFLARNPFGQVPVIEDGDFTLADSNAILVYLALRHDPARRWLPARSAPAAQPCNAGSAPRPGRWPRGRRPRAWPSCSSGRRIRNAWPSPTSCSA